MPNITQGINSPYGHKIYGQRRYSLHERTPHPLPPKYKWSSPQQTNELPSPPRTNELNSCSPKRFNLVRGPKTTSELQGEPEELPEVRKQKSEPKQNRTHPTTTPQSNRHSTDDSVSGNTLNTNGSGQVFVETGGIERPGGGGGTKGLNLSTPGPSNVISSQSNLSTVVAQEVASTSIWSNLGNFLWSCLSGLGEGLGYVARGAWWLLRNGVGLIFFVIRVPLQCVAFFLDD